MLKIPRVTTQSHDFCSKSLCVCAGGSDVKLCARSLERKAGTILIQQFCRMVTRRNMIRVDGKRSCFGSGTVYAADVGG